MHECCVSNIVKEYNNVWTQQQDLLTVVLKEGQKIKYKHPKDYKPLSDLLNIYSKHSCYLLTDFESETFEINEGKNSLSQKDSKH